MRYAQTWTDARLRAIRDLTPTIRLFEIVPETGPHPQAPGSHINIGVVVAGRPDTRSYSLVGLPDPECYRIAVKRQPAGRGGSAYLWSLGAGARLAVSDPQALFAVDHGRSDTLLVAGGIGITPILGMALRLAAAGDRLRLAYAVRSRAEAAFADELAAALGDRLTLHVGEAGGRLDLGAAFARLPPDGQAAICGPLPMLDEARGLWRAAGRSPADLRYETFGSSGRHAPEPFTVRLPQEGREILVPATSTMLDALAEAGVEIIADCRRGECGLCAVDVLAVDGEIDHRDVFFSDEQKRRGRKICACVSRAVGSIAIDTAYRSD
ncbi:PDR/VanB family oxidoreductase [Inquilinus sp. CA228]|uniref:PDR/VanB family oxidoreductase n=1 Tax=Inquilinus sp. CA228 TaxID=3455609 RepID=UPI003F8CF4E5